MHGKIVIIKADGTHTVTPFAYLEQLEQARAKYKHIATEWDYDPKQTGNPVTYYFAEREELKP